MYKKTISRGSRSGSSYSPHGRRSFGKKPSHSAPRGGNQKRKFVGSYIDERLFINRAQHIVVETYTPTHTFSDFGFSNQLMVNIAHKKYVTPSPIQDQGIPEVMKGKDLIGIANTGTGKTAAFLLPLIEKMLKNPTQKVMVLAPTRELAQQIEKELRDFTFGMRIYSVTCVGGMPLFPQIRSVERGVNFIIGTPGRVKDLIARGTIKMNQFQTIVLDEADRMLDMGFINDIRHILDRMTAKEQSLFFSATFPPAIKVLCEKFLHNPVTISVKTRDTAQGIDQDVVRVKDKTQKIEQLHEILTDPNCSKVLIFREMKRHVDALKDELVDRGFKAMALHGDMRNRQRQHAVQSLANGNTQIVIATDVAARGIDIPDITHVINYDIPNDYETYIHRIGRTGRGASKGTALTFIER